MKLEGRCFEYFYWFREILVSYGNFIVLLELNIVWFWILVIDFLIGFFVFEKRLNKFFLINIFIRDYVNNDRRE